MTLSSHPLRAKRVPIHERACTVGNVTAINAYRANRTLLKQRLTAGGYQLHETLHFLLCRRAEAPSTIVVHWFAPEAIDADIGHYFMQELKPPGMLARTQDFGELFGAVVCSLAPHDAQRALRLYGTNTLQRYQQLLATATAHTLSGSPVAVFSTLYRRVCELVSGERFLDAGCSFGFLPLLIAERFPSLVQVVGVDIHTDSFAIMRAIAEERQLKNVQFEQADLLSDNVSKLGQFDTVALLHVLEHFSEENMYRVLTNLLRVTTQRLIIAVPYERGEPETAYGHEQLFSRSKLEAIGEWCLQQWEEEGQVRYEDSADGLLLVER